MLCGEPSRAIGKEARRVRSPRFFPFLILSIVLYICTKIELVCIYLLAAYKSDGYGGVVSS